MVKLFLIFEFKIYLMKKLIIPFILVVFAGCSPEKPLVKIRFTGETQGTYYTVTYFDNKGRDFQMQVDSLLEAFDRSVSLWVPGSVISRINRNDTAVVTDTVFREMFRRSGEVFEATGGAFDPTIGPLVNAWGFGFKEGMKIDEKVIDSLLPLVDFGNVRMETGKVIKSDPRIHIDFNAIAQGYSVDLTGEFLESKGIDSYLVDVGGEVLAVGTKPDGGYWTVGIEKPADSAMAERKLKARVSLKDKALATSGNYRKYYIRDGVRYSHTLDPASGYPVQHPLLSVTVLANDCATADAYATAFMVMGLERAKEFLEGADDLEAYFIYSGPEEELLTHYSRGFAESLTEEY